MYREQDQDLKTQLPAVLENLHDNRPLRTGVERGEEGEPQQKAKRPGRRARLHGASGKRTLVAVAVVIAMIGGRRCRRALVAGWPLHRFDRRRLRAAPTTRRWRQRFRATSPASRSRTMRRSRPAMSSPPSTTAIIGSPSRRRATRSRPSRRPSTASAGKSSPRAPLIDQAKAQFIAAQADAKKTQLEFARQQALAKQQFASQQILEQAEANRDQAAAAVQSAQSVIDAAQDNLDVLKAQQQRSGAHARRTQDRAGASRARPVVHRDPRAGRWRLQQPRGADRRLRADRPAHRQPRAAERRLYRRQFQGNAAGADRARPAGLDQRRCACPRTRSRAASRASRRHPARCSRCCRPTTPPAISPRSCNGCRCVSRCRPRSRRSACCGPGMSVVVSVDTKPGHATEAGLTSAAHAAEADAISH